MQWDYCDRSRGPSAEKPCFYDNLSRLAAQVEPFWYDEYITDLPRLRRLLIEKAAAFNPDLIFFIPYTGQFDAGTLDRLKAGWRTCAWFGDDTWRFESYSAKMAPHFTHALTTDIFSVDKYRALGIEPIVTQWAAQPYSQPQGPLKEGEQYSFEVSFVGARNEVRGWFVDQLARAGIKVECFGAGWPAGKVSFEKMDEIFRKSKINLNLSNSVSRDIRFVFGGPRNLARYLISKKSSEQIKARNFEIPLAGGFQLTSYAAGIEKYFRIGEEAAVFTSPEECAGQIRYFLGNDAERRRVAAAGYERAVNEHTCLHRLRKILEAIWP